MIRHRLPAAAVAAVALLTACHPSTEEDPGTAQRVKREALAPRPVRLVRPEARRERPTLELLGEIRPDELVPVPAEVSGRVGRVLVEAGDAVAAGAPLAEIDRATYEARLARAEADLAAARAELALAEKELARKRDLIADHTISQAVYDRAQAQRDLAAAKARAAEAATTLARRDLERSVVRAPAAGVVDRRRVAPGAWVDVGQPVVDLALVERLKVACQVPAGWGRNLVGVRRLRFRTGDSSQYEAGLLSVQPVAEDANRAFEVVGVFSPEPGASLRPGSVVTVVLEAGHGRTTLWVPGSAVATGEMAQVMVVRDGKARRRNVLIGRRENGTVEIVQGLTADEAIIEDVAGLSDGVSVSVEPQR